MAALEDLTEKFIISSVTLAELENLKTSFTKDLDIKIKAQKTLSFLSNNLDKYQVIIHKTDYEKKIKDLGLPVNNDTMILSDAIFCDSKMYPDEIIFVTNDLALFNIANLAFGNDSIEIYHPKESEEYLGYREHYFNSQEDELLAQIYEHPEINPFDLNVNEYLIMKDECGNLMDIKCWTGEKLRSLKYKDFSSYHLSNTAPYKNDVYQRLLFDSLQNNKMTFVGGPPGSGKSYVALSYLFDLLENSNKINKIIVFCNPIVAKNAAKLGFYPGSVEEKLLSTQVGAILSSKLGGMIEVNKLIAEEKLILLPAGDARGYEVPAGAGVYIMEAQNLDITLLKMLLQRIGEDCYTVIDGDYQRQIDLDIYSGKHNGLKRMSEIFRGQDFYGQVILQNIYRSKISEIAEQM